MEFILRIENIHFEGNNYEIDSPTNNTHQYINQLLHTLSSSTSGAQDGDEWESIILKTL